MLRCGKTELEVHYTKVQKGHQSSNAKTVKDWGSIFNKN